MGKFTGPGWLQMPAPQGHAADERQTLTSGTSSAASAPAANLPHTSPHVSGSLSLSNPSPSPPRAKDPTSPATPTATPPSLGQASAWRVLTQSPAVSEGSGIQCGDTVRMVRSIPPGNQVVVFSPVFDTYAVCAADALTVSDGPPASGKNINPGKSPESSTDATSASTVDPSDAMWYDGDPNAGTLTKEAYDEILVPHHSGTKAPLQTFTGDPRYDDCTLEEHRLADYIHNELLWPAITPAGPSQVRVAAGTVTVRACGDFDGEYTRDYDPSRGQCYRHPLREDVGIWLEDESEQARRWVLGMLDRCARFFTSKAPSRDENGPLRPPEQEWRDANDGRAEAMTTTFTAGTPHASESAGATAPSARNVAEEAKSGPPAPSLAQPAVKAKPTLAANDAQVETTAGAFIGAAFRVLPPKLYINLGGKYTCSGDCLDTITLTETSTPNTWNVDSKTKSQFSRGTVQMIGRELVSRFDTGTEVRGLVMEREGRDVLCWIDGANWVPVND